MREIKFRAWDKAEKKMIYSALEIKDIGLGEGSLLLNSDTQKGNELIWIQYTGLKDKNGKDIYEGDIVKADTGVIGYIGFQNGAFYWTDGAGHWDMEKITENIIKKCIWAEVIGNIYENPKLLKAS